MPSKRLLLLLGSLCALLLSACQFELPGLLSDQTSPLSPLESPLSPLRSPLSTPAASQAPPPAGLIPGFPSSPQTLALIVIGAIVLSVITGFVVFGLIRGWPRARARSDRSRTARLPAAEQESQGLLPKGTLVGDGRFEVVDGRVGDGVNVYEIKPTTPLRICPRCYSRLAEAAGGYCGRCGQVLPGADAAYPTLLARESLNPQRFAVAMQLTALNLAHASVVTPVDVFVEPAFEPVRYFQVEPRIAGGLASDLNVPQPLDDVLTWGITLARGMAYLHAHDVFLERVTPERVLVDDEAGRWICFDNIYVVPQEGDPQVQQRRVADVRGLGGMLLLWATGKAVPKGCAELPQPVCGVLTRALKADEAFTADDFAAELERARETLVQQRHLVFRVGAHTDVGQLRRLNEDSLLAVDLSEAFATLDVSAGVFGVADGVGGNAAGDVASQLTVATLTRYLDDLRSAAAKGQMPDARAWIVQAAMAANEAVYAERQAVSNDMGCTLVMGVVIGGSAVVLNVGDSRCYKLGPRDMRQVTTDHSIVQRLVDIGQLTREEARHHPQKSVIYRVIGDSLKLGYDLFDAVLAPGEALLFCSDGLSDMVEDDVIWRTWRGASSPQEACDWLVQLANRAGGQDNITVVIVQAQE